MFDRSKYLICQKCHVSDVYYHNYMKIKTNSDDDLPLEKSLSTQNTMIFLEPIFDNNYKRYSHSVRLANCLYKLVE